MLCYCLNRCHVLFSFKEFVHKQTVHNKSPFSCFLIGPFCGNDAPEVITVHGNNATVLFISDGETTAQGFSLDWQAI